MQIEYSFGAYYGAYSKKFSDAQVRTATDICRNRYRAKHNLPKRYVFRFTDLILIRRDVKKYLGHITCQEGRSHFKIDDQKKSKPFISVYRNEAYTNTR